MINVTLSPGYNLLINRLWERQTWCSPIAKGLRDSHTIDKKLSAVGYPGCFLSTLSDRNLNTTLLGGLLQLLGGLLNKPNLKLGYWSRKVICRPG